MASFSQSDSLEMALGKTMNRNRSMPSMQTQQDSIQRQQAVHPMNYGDMRPSNRSMSVSESLNMELVKTVNKQMNCMQTQQENCLKQQELIAHLTQQILVLGGVPRPLPGQQMDTLIPPGKLRATAPKPAGGRMSEAACLGVVRLDYDYPPSPGDIDHPDSFGYDVYYRVVPGFTFEVCQSGRMSKSVQEEFVEAIKWLANRGVSGITGDCGFMMYFQKLARNHTTKPVFMSALAQLPAVTCGYASNELIAILTANGQSLKPMRSLIKDECGVDTDEMRYIFVGCEDVPGFEAVAAGGKVDVARVTPGIVAKCKLVLQTYPKIRAFLFECTELPAYSDAVRQAFGLPVYDAITCCDFFISGAKDNKRFGINNWQQDWDGQQADYTFGTNLSHEDKLKLVNKIV